MGVAPFWVLLPLPPEFPLTRPSTHPPLLVHPELQGAIGSGGNGDPKVGLHAPALRYCVFCEYRTTQGFILVTAGPEAVSTACTNTVNATLTKDDKE